MKVGRRLAMALLLALLFTMPAAAWASPKDFTGMTLEQVMDDFMEEFQLSEKNWAISYYNTVTGESYAFNDTHFSIAASTYKLPLNLYFYEMEQRGEITGDTIIPRTGLPLSQIHRESIVNSNNELSEALMYYWGDHTTYKDKMRTYFTMTDEEIDPLYYQGNYYCVRMMMDTLQYLYERQDQFPELISYMKEAKPGEYFKAGVDEYEIAHKYGAVQIFVNDVGIIYTPQPILLAVYTWGIYGDGICANAARLLTDYTVWKAQQEPAEPPAPAVIPLPVEPLPEAAEEAEPEEQPQEEVEPEPPADVPAAGTPSQPEVQTPQGEGATMGDMIPLLLLGATVLVLVGLLITWRVQSHRRNRRRRS